MGLELVMIFILVIGLIFQMAILFDRKKNNMDQSYNSLQNQLSSLQHNLTSIMQQSDKNVTDTLQKSYSELQLRLDRASQVIGDLKSETGKFSEIGRSMQSLQDFLNSPKLRGNIGEKILADLMSQVLPKETYSIQYRFNSGEIVDAAIKTRAGIIAIDSKFPMENFSKLTKATTKPDQELFARAFANDVKKHIKTISTKYINTDENTVDFALMYVPAESIYYEITANQVELSAYAQEQRVLLVSPSTFYAFLRTILVSFEGLRIANEAQAILASLRSIQKESLGFGEKLSLLSKHMTNAYNTMNVVSSEFNGLATKITQTSNLQSGQNELLQEKSV